MNSSTAKATSSGPCIFGLTTYMDPVSELGRCDSVRRSRRLPTAVTRASRMPSGTSLPSLSSTASVVIRWPTCRMNSSERPRNVTSSPEGAVQVRSGFIGRVKVLPPLLTSGASVPSISCSQLR